MEFDKNTCNHIFPNWKEYTKNHKNNFRDGCFCSMSLNSIKVYHYYLYIDTFVVNSDVQGNGIGKMLIEKLKENMFRNRIFSLKLMTKSDIKAYKIYRHLGFDEPEGYVHMQCY